MKRGLPLLLVVLSAIPLAGCGGAGHEAYQSGDESLISKLLPLGTSRQAWGQSRKVDSVNEDSLNFPGPSSGLVGYEEYLFQSAGDYPEGGYDYEVPISLVGYLPRVQPPGPDEPGVDFVVVWFVKGKAAGIHVNTSYNHMEIVRKLIPGIDQLKLYERYGGNADCDIGNYSKRGDEFDDSVYSFAHRTTGAAAQFTEVVTGGTGADSGTCY